MKTLEFVLLMIPRFMARLMSHDNKGQPCKHKVGQSHSVTVVQEGSVLLLEMSLATKLGLTNKIASTSMH